MLVAFFCTLSILVTSLNVFINFHFFFFTLWISNVMLADNGENASFPAPVPVAQHPSDLMKGKIKSNSLRYLKWSVCTMFPSFSPGDHRDSLHTCGPPDANLCPAPHHHVLPREVCTEIYWFFTLTRAASNNLLFYSLIYWLLSQWIF